ncbi:MAG: DNA primase [Clostridia bacterium]|nr:DNA primase [Clostridia bacterium]
MAVLNEKFISELKSKCNIVDIVGRYCVLQRKGSSNYWARCPLPGHSEKTPSFTVNEPGQFYHCFGCGKSGDVVKFIEEVEALSFYEAVKFLADIAKMEMPEGDEFNEDVIKKNKESKERLLAVLKDTAHFYVNNLKKPEANDYLKYLDKRGFSSETIRAFGIGASLSFDGLPKHLKSLGYTESEMLESGVCQKSEKGNVFDAEANRLTIPVINTFNQVIAFTGRVLKPSSDKIGKYKNTQETKIYLKKKTLFNINNLKKLRTDKQLPFVIMVEGNLDVVSLHQAGFKNVACSMGTSLTLDQAKVLKRFTDVVYICFDGDSAGKEATLRSLDIFASEEFEIRVVPLPEGKDPDDVIRTGGKEAYQKLLDKALPLIDFKLKVVETGKDLSNVSDKRKYITEALDVIRSVANESLKEELLQKVRDVSGRTYESLKRDLEHGVSSPKEETFTVPKTTVKSTATDRAERFIIYSFIHKKDFAVFDDDLYFNNLTCQKLAETVVFGLNNVEISKLSTLVNDDELVEVNEILNCGELIAKDGEEKYYNDCVLALKQFNLETEIANLNKQYAKETDINSRKEIGKVLLKLTQKLTNLKNGG